MRIVFDTNVYISAIAFPGSKSALAFSVASRRVFDLVTSDEIVSELIGKLAEPKFDFSESQLTAVFMSIDPVARSRSARTIPPRPPR